LRHLEKQGAVFLREGTRHTIYRKGALKTEIPRRNEIVDELARKICKDLNIPFVR
jgi:mRNA interferase HicA